MFPLSVTEDSSGRVFLCTVWLHIWSDRRAHGRDCTVIVERRMEMVLNQWGSVSRVDERKVYKRTVSCVYPYSFRPNALFYQYLMKKKAGRSLTNRPHRANSNQIGVGENSVLRVKQRADTCMGTCKCESATCSHVWITCRYNITPEKRTGMHSMRFLCA